MNSALFLAISSLFSQILGFIRDKLVAHIYGAGFFLDSYYAAFRVPEFMYLSVGSFVSSAILVPLFSKKLYDEDRVIWFQKLCTTFIIFFIIIYGIVIWLLPYLSSVFYGHKDFLFQQSVTIYGSILLVSTFFLSLSSIISSVAQQRRKFIVVGIAPILYNLGTVIGIVFLRPLWGISGVCIGVVLGSVLHLAIQMPVVIREGLFVGYGSFILKAFSFKLLSKTLGKSFLRTLSLVFSAISFFLITYFASHYQIGAITVISLAFTLQTVFHTIIGVSYTTTIFPALSDAYVNKNHILFDFILTRAFKRIFLISMILMALIILFRFEIVYILFGSGKFTMANVVLTAGALGIFTISLYAQNAILLISRAAYAKGDYVLPLVTNMISAVGLFVMALLFEQNKYLYSYGVLLIPLAYTIGQYIALGVSFSIHQRKREIKSPHLGFVYMFKITSSVFGVAIVCRFILEMFLFGKTGIIIHLVYSLFVFFIFCLFSYVVLGLFKDEHIQNDRQSIKNFIKKSFLALLPRFR